MIPGFEPWYGTLIFDKKSQRLLGDQIISDSESADRTLNCFHSLWVVSATFGICEQTRCVEATVMEELAPNFGFKLMSLTFNVRDIVSQVTANHLFSLSSRDRKTYTFRRRYTGMQSWNEPGALEEVNQAITVLNSYC